MARRWEDFGEIEQYEKIPSTGNCGEVYNPQLPIENFRPFFFLAVYYSILKRSARGPLCNISHFRNVGKSSTQKCLHEGRNFLKGNKNYSNDFVERNKSRDWGCSLNWLHEPLLNLNFIHIEKRTAHEPQNGEITYKFASSLLSAGFQISPCWTLTQEMANRKGCI